MKSKKFKLSDLVLVPQTRIGEGYFTEDSKVVLRSGGPVMCILELGEITALCAWFDVCSLTFKTHMFGRDCLAYHGYSV